MPESNYNNQNHRPPLSSSNIPLPMEIDGSEEDAMVADADFLTRYEVLKRRSRRLKQLARIYKDHYWALMEDMRIRYRDYYWEYGVSPFQEDETHGDSTVVNPSNPNKTSTGRILCAMTMCKSKAMPLTKYCHLHILSDSEQKLYMPCDFVVKWSQSGPILCQKPTLRSTNLVHCPLHFQKSEKHVARALKMAGLNASCTSKMGPKLHVIISEYVGQIKQKRRAAKKSELENSDISC